MFKKTKTQRKNNYTPLMLRRIDRVLYKRLLYQSTSRQDPHGECVVLERYPWSGELPPKTRVRLTHNTSNTFVNIIVPMF